MNGRPFDEAHSGSFLITALLTFTSTELIAVFPWEGALPNGFPDEWVAFWAECAGHLEDLPQLALQIAVYTQGGAEGYLGELVFCTVVSGVTIMVRVVLRRLLGRQATARVAPAIPPPNGLKIESVAQCAITLAWEQGSAQSFEVQWRRASNPAWQTFATVRKSKARVSGLDAGAAYAFRVRAVGGEWSHEVSAQLSAPTPPADDSAVVAHLQLITGASAEAARAALVAHGNDANAAAAALLARWRPPAAKAATQKSRDLLPGYWNPSMNRLNATKFSVAPGSEEYTRVEKAFMLTLDDPSRELKRDQFTIQSVERIQNMDLWNLYVAKRKSICGRKNPKDAQSLVRNWLFHGCAGDVTAKIIQGGFNRSFAGRNATRYGKGVYFARDASYSTYPLYSQRDANDVQSIFLARVVVGEYCLGVQDAITPDVRDAATRALYDSTVDNLQNPNIFVTYNDGQAYPEYLVKFKQDGNPSSFPATGKPAPPDYRPNVFDGCYD